MCNDWYVHVGRGCVSELGLQPNLARCRVHQVDAAYNFGHALQRIVNDNGDKLSKLTGAPGISLHNVEHTLTDALVALQQDPPPQLARASLADVWSWAIENWQVENLLGRRAIAKTP